MSGVGKLEQVRFLLDYISRFISYCEQVQGSKPRAIYLPPEHFELLGVQPAPVTGVCRWRWCHEIPPF